MSGTAHSPRQITAFCNPYGFRGREFPSAATGEAVIRNEQEFDAVVTAVSMVGVMVEIDGEKGFIDQTKHPSWWSSEASPSQVGDLLHVVVLDDSRTPPRLSALEKDIEIARRLRGEGN